MMVSRSGPRKIFSSNIVGKVSHSDTGGCGVGAAAGGATAGAAGRGGAGWPRAGEAANTAVTSRVLHKAATAANPVVGVAAAFFTVLVKPIIPSEFHANADAATPVTAATDPTVG